MVSTADRAASTAATPSFSLLQDAPSPALGMAACKIFSFAALLARASNALGSPRKAFCASNGMRCSTSASFSAGAATGAAPCDNSVRAAAAVTHSASSPASTGRKLKLDPVSVRLVINFSTRLACRLQEALTLHQRLQTEH